MKKLFTNQDLFWEPLILHVPPGKRGRLLLCMCFVCFCTHWRVLPLSFAGNGLAASWTNWESRAVRASLTVVAFLTMGKVSLLKAIQVECLHAGVRSLTDRVPELWWLLIFATLELLQWESLSPTKICSDSFAPKHTSLPGVMLDRVFLACKTPIWCWVVGRQQQIVPLSMNRRRNFTVLWWPSIFATLELVAMKKLFTNQDLFWEPLILHVPPGKRGRLLLCMRFVCFCTHWRVLPLSFAGNGLAASWTNWESRAVRASLTVVAFLTMGKFLCWKKFKWSVCMQVYAVWQTGCRNYDDSWYLLL